MRAEREMGSRASVEAPQLKLLMPKTLQLGEKPSLKALVKAPPPPKFLFHRFCLNL